MHIEIISSLEQVSPLQWNSLVKDDNPFVRHEFLIALERHNCVGEAFGWLPHHIVVYEGEELIGAMPLYEKYNSYGEFVFDHAWANAYKHHGLNYYPKLVSSIPYTPASGQRLLSKAGCETEMYPVLLSTAMHLTNELQASGFHCLFALCEEQDWLEQQAMIVRHDCQFHWKNFNYQSFDEFLATLSAKKRKNIRQERRKVTESGVKLRILDGHSASQEDWKRFAFFYTHTFESKWGMPTLNEGFFAEVGANLPDQVVLVMADLEGECIAGSLMYRSDTHLFGRHWGCVEYVDNLHFEACYYQGIEYCIRNGLAVFEPGAQGEHKVPRGFIPTLTRSSHWLSSEMFRQPVQRHCEHEQQAVAHYIDSVREHLPYRAEFIEQHLNTNNA